ncbi:hypothetical protein CLOM_g19994 [Closterium sp. NIES-68]|nr:hypothetical protein CLOM_g19994 [Closterium sp. NIES-68]GJP61023.1 hypothetical protein CLOP_g18236 [Closterium sp. NIES-67]
MAARTRKMLRAAPRAPSQSLWDELIKSRRAENSFHHQYDSVVPSAAARLPSDWAGYFSRLDSCRLEARAGPAPSLFHHREPLRDVKSSKEAVSPRVLFTSQGTSGVVTTGVTSYESSLPSPSPSRQPWPFVCTVCGSRFASLQALGGHKSAHRDGRNVGGRTLGDSGGKTKGASTIVGGKLVHAGKRGFEALKHESERNDSESDAARASDAKRRPAVLIGKVESPESPESPPRTHTRSSGAGETRQNGGHQSGTMDPERAAILAGIRQELTRLKRQKVSHVAEVPAGAVSSEGCEADVAKLEADVATVEADVATRSISASSAAMGGCGEMVRAEETEEQQQQQQQQQEEGGKKEDEQEKERKEQQEQRELKDSNDAAFGTVELELFRFTGVGTEMVWGSSRVDGTLPVLPCSLCRPGSACEEEQGLPLCTAVHPPAPAPVVDLALHL